MRLKERTRCVQFIPAGHHVVRMSLPLNVLQKKGACCDTGKIWMSSITEKYKGRPKTDEFFDKCLAKFASEYRIVSKSEQSNAIKLDYDFRYVKKRTSTHVAVVRYVRFSPSKNPEKYYHSFYSCF